MSEQENKPSLLEAAKAVLEAWRDYYEDDFQIEPDRLLDEPDLIGNLEAAVDAEGDLQSVAVRARNTMDAVVPLLKTLARTQPDFMGPVVTVAIGACEQLQFEARTAVPTEAPDAE